MNQVDSDEMTVNGVPVDEMSDVEARSTLKSMIRDLERTKEQREEYRTKLKKLLGIA